MTRRPLALSLAFVAALVAPGFAPVQGQGEQPPQTLLKDSFEASLDPARWEPMRVHDTRTDRIEVEGGRLTLAFDTLGTDDATVKLRGLRSREVFETGSGLALEATLDWNGQSNGCYLTLGLALAGEAEGDPRAAQEALAFEWVGVPPGKNVRPLLWSRAKGAVQLLFTDGWPQPRVEERVGVTPRPVRVRVEAHSDRARLLVDGAERWSGPATLAGRVRAWVFATGHSNYPLRTVLVDALAVERLP